MITTFQGLADAIDPSVRYRSHGPSTSASRSQCSLENPSFFVAHRLEVLRAGYSVACQSSVVSVSFGPSVYREPDHDTQGWCCWCGREIGSTCLVAGACNSAAGSLSAPARRGREYNRDSIGNTGCRKNDLQDEAAREQRFGDVPYRGPGGSTGRPDLPGLRQVSVSIGCAISCSPAGPHALPSSEEALWLISTFARTAVVSRNQQQRGSCRDSGKNEKKKRPLSAGVLTTVAKSPARRLSRKWSGHCALTCSKITFYARLKRGPCQCPLRCIENVPEAVGCRTGRRASDRR